MFALPFWRHTAAVHLFIHGICEQSVGRSCDVFFLCFVAAVAASGAVGVVVVGPVEHKIKEPSATTMTTGHHSTFSPSLSFPLRDEVVRSLAVVRR